MKLTKLMFFLVTGVFLLPALAKANELDVRAGDIRVIKDMDGNVYVNTGKSRASTSKEHPSVFSDRHQDYYRQPGNSCDGSRVSIQESTQIIRDDRTTVEQSSVIKDCR